MEIMMLPKAEVCDKEKCTAPAVKEFSVVVGGRKLNFCSLVHSRAVVEPIRRKIARRNAEVDSFNGA